MNPDKQIISYPKASVILYFSITVALSAAAELAIILINPSWGYLALMWIPAFAALVASIAAFCIKKERFSPLAFLRFGGFRRCKFRYILLGVGLPLAYILIPYLIYWLAFPGTFTTQAVGPINLIISLTIAAILGTLLSLLSALGEEIGWRGFMVPALMERLGLKKTLLLSSVIWIAWHLPLLIFADYMEGAALWYQVPAFILCILPVGIIAGILTVRSNSVWPAAFLHAAHNNFDQAMFGVMTLGESKMYFVSETGIFTIVCAWAIAILLYLGERKRQSALSEQA